MRKISLKGDKKGFTLIELLIVIIIIGILAAIAFVAYSGSQNRAKKADAEASLAQIRSKLGEYNADQDRYPDDQPELATWLGSAEGGNNDALATKFTTANGFTYTATDCDASDTNCSGYEATAAGTIFGGASPADDITVNN